MGKKDEHTVIRKDAQGHVRSRIKVGDAKSAQVIANKMAAKDPSGTVEIKKGS